jgi:hypothetical protein
MRSTFAFAALMGAFLSLIQSRAVADELVLQFSGTYASATVTGDLTANNQDGNGTTETNSDVPQVPAGLVGSSFSGEYFFDNSVAPVSSNGTESAQYTETDQGLPATSYTAGDLTETTQASIAFNMLNYQITNRNSDTTPDTILVENYPVSPPRPSVFDGIHILPSSSTDLPELENYAAAPIIPLTSLGINSNTLWYGDQDVYAPDGSVLDGAVPSNIANADTPEFAFFMIASELELAFENNSPAATDTLPGPGPVDLSQFSSATLSFQTLDNANTGDPYQFAYQDILSVVGTITSATISEVPEPSHGAVWAGILSILFFGRRLRSRRAAGAALDSVKK